MKKNLRIFTILFVLLMMIPFLSVKAYEYDSTKPDVPSLRVFEDGTVKYDKSQFYAMYVSLKYDESNQYLTSIFQSIDAESFNIINLIENECAKNMYAFNCREGLEGTYDLLIRAGDYNSEFTFTYADGKISGSIVEQKYVLTIQTNEPTCKVTYNSKDYSNGETIIAEEGEEIRLFAKAGAGFRFNDATSSDTTVAVNGSVGRIIVMPKKNATVTFSFNQLPEYEASLDSINLGTAIKGYEPNDFSQIFRVNVTGLNSLNADVNHFKVELTGGNTEAFDLWVNNGGTFNSGSTYNAGSIKPAAGLEKGTYNATYTLYYDRDGEETEYDFTPLATGNVSLKVSDNAYTLTILTNDPSCKVTYNSKDYSSGETISIPEGEEVRLFAKAASGFVFTNAVSNDVSIAVNGSIGRIIVMPEKDVTVTFNFTELPKVIFDTNGGSEIESQVFSSSPVYIDMPDDPVKQGYTFMGWYSDKELTEEFDFDIEHELTGDLTLYAKWKSNFMTPSAKISANNNTLTITWDFQEDATRYELYRSLNNKKWNRIKVTSDVSFIDKSLTYNKTYYYKVRAYNGTNWTSYSKVVSKKVLPNKVTNVKVSGNSDSLKVSWSKVSTTGYEVYMNNKKVTTIKKNGTLTYNKKKLKANTTYKFKVRAYKTVSGKKVYGPWSSTITSKTAPAKPKVSIGIKDYNALNVKINASKGANKYILEGSLDGKKYTLIENLPNEGTLSQEDLETGKTYYYRVKACNLYNCSGWVTTSKKSTTKTPGFTLKTSSKKVTVTLSSVNMADGYEIHRATKKKGKYTKVKELTSESELVYNNKTKKGTTYYYKVRSYKMVDGNRVYSPFSSIKSIKSK